MFQACIYPDRQGDSENEPSANQYSLCLDFNCRTPAASAKLPSEIQFSLTSAN